MLNACIYPLFCLKPEISGDASSSFLSYALPCLFGSFLVTLNKSMSSAASMPYDYFIVVGMFKFLLSSTLFCFIFEYYRFSYLGVHSDFALLISVLTNVPFAQA